MERIKKHKNHIQIDLTKWFRANENTLKSDPNDRIRNLAVAIRLLPLFEKFPTGWGACAYLNESKTNQEKSFPVYLSDWYHACPNQNQKWFVEKIASKFGIALPSLH